MRFNEVLGHDRSLSIIQAHLANNCLSGAYIFSGPEGIGKKMVARIIAQELKKYIQENKKALFLLALRDLFRVQAYLHRPLLFFLQR